MRGSISARQEMTASVLNILAGLWEIAAPWTWGYSALGGATVNAVVVGAVAALLAALRILGIYRASWTSWANAFLGIWLIMAPFVVGYSADWPAMTNDIIVGVVMLILGSWSGTAGRPALR